MGTELKITLKDYLRANRKAAREAEIAVFGCPVKIDRIHKSKKVYNRKKNKADLNKDLPYFCIY